MDKAAAGKFLFEAAVVEFRCNRHEAALERLTDCLRANPNIADAWSLRARVEADAGRHFNAVLHHGFATKLEPHRHDLWVNRAIDEMSARMYAESEKSYLRSIAIKPSYEGHYNYGNLLSSLMRIDEAVENYQAAITIGGVDNAQIYANLGVALIAQGNLREGFGYYRHRFNAPGFPPRAHFHYPIWQGEPLAGKTIMLYPEQGFGDELMSYRFGKPLKDMGARVIVCARPPVFRLARQSLDWADAVVLMYDPPPWVPDYICAFLDVPAWIDVDPVALPLAAGYLKADDRGFDLGFPPGLKVGICWASGKRDLQPNVLETARQKTLTFKQLSGLARPGVTLVSLQRDHSEGAALRELGVKDPMQVVTDFADTAWVINHLDLVVTVDTAVAHLAAAMGKPTWNLVRFDALWPWALQDTGTPWYDSMRIYRQPAPFDWPAVLKAMLGDFSRLVDQAAAA